MSAPKHDCREHILVSHGPSGGKRLYVCGVCRRPVHFRLRPDQVLARVPA